MDKWEGNKWVRVLHIMNTVATKYSGYQTLHFFMKNVLIASVHVEIEPAFELSNCSISVQFGII